MAYGDFARSVDLAAACREMPHGLAFCRSVQTSLLLPSWVRPLASLTACCAFTDFRRDCPTAVNADSPLDAALGDMIRLGVSTLAVIQQGLESADPYLVGLITAYDIERERPHRPQSTSRSNLPEDLVVADVVTPWDELPLVNFESLRTMSRRDLNATFQSASSTPHLVIEMQGPESMLARGLLSRAAPAERRSASRARTDHRAPLEFNTVSKTTGVQLEES